MAEHLSAAAVPGPAIPVAGVAEEGTLVDFAGWVSDCAVEVGDLVPDARPSGRRPPLLASTPPCTTPSPPADSKSPQS